MVIILEYTNSLFHWNQQEFCTLNAQLTPQLSNEVWNVLPNKAVLSMFVNTFSCKQVDNCFIWQEPVNYRDYQTWKGVKSLLAGELQVSENILEKSKIIIMIYRSWEDGVWGVGAQVVEDGSEWFSQVLGLRTRTGQIKPLWPCHEDFINSWHLHFQFSWKNLLQNHKGVTWRPNK